MKRSISFLILVFFFTQSSFSQKKPEYVLMIHGGCGNFTKNDISDSLEIEYRKGLEAALDKGSEILSNGGTSIEAVEACVMILEDNPLFNAGKGSVFTDAGINELDASIMDGKTLNAGAIAGVRTIKNPISAARKVMDDSPHVMLIGTGAEEFAKEQGVEIVDPSYFFTQKRWDYYINSKQKKKEFFEKKKNGTVGAVALDKYGNLAAATSTGGMSNKKYGRVGDSPIIGAGTYANNNTCAVSGTGWGEYFIRNVVAYSISALVEFEKLPISDAAEKVVNGKLKSLNANGGIIAIDKEGKYHFAFNTDGMFRGVITSDDIKQIELYSIEQK